MLILRTERTQSCFLSSSSVEFVSEKLSSQNDRNYSLYHIRNRYSRDAPYLCVVHLSFLP